MRLLAIAIITSLIVLGVTVPVYPSPAAMPEVVIEHAGLDDRSPELERLLRRASEIELRRQELEYRTADVSDEPGTLEAEDDLIDRSALFESDFYLFGTYWTSDERLSVRYRLVDISRSEVIADAERDGPIDLVLDRVAREAVRAVVDAADERLAEVRAEREAAVAESDEAREVDRTEPGDPVVAPGEAVDRIEPVFAPDPPLRRLELSIQGNAILSLGEFAEYLPYGFATTSTLLAWLGENEGGFGLGFTAGYQHMLAREQGFAQFARSFVPIGADIHLSPWHNNGVTLRFSASGGAAIRIHDGSFASDRLSAAIPYSTLAVTTTVRLGERFGLGVQAGARSLFHIYREDKDAAPQVEPLPAFSPGVYLFRRL